MRATKWSVIEDAVRRFNRLNESENRRKVDEDARGGAVVASRPQDAQWVERAMESAIGGECLSEHALVGFARDRSEHNRSGNRCRWSHWPWSSGPPCKDRSSNRGVGNKIPNT